MRKYVIILFGFLLFFTGCGFNEAPEETNISEEQLETPVYLELHFGNGEILRKEISYLYAPDTYGGGDYCKGFVYKKLSSFEDSFFPTLLNCFKYNISTINLCTAVFPDEQKYFFHEVKGTDVNVEKSTLIAYLWRDEPYETERNYFEVVQEKE